MLEGTLLHSFLVVSGRVVFQAFLGEKGRNLAPITTPFSPVSRRLKSLKNGEIIIVFQVDLCIL
jgi:hypothetical protein